MSVTLADIEAAATLLEGIAIPTPMEESRWLQALVGGPVLLKCENLQRTGSFKIRGGYVRLSRLSPEERARGVVAASAGNHAQGVALAAQMLGINATVFMPEGAPIPKVNATRAYGADVLFEGEYLTQALLAAQAFAEETGAVFIHPFDHRDIVAGQGTVGLEILDQAPELETVLVPTGGGGLLAGVALAVKARRPDVRVVGVQAEEAAAYPESLRAGAPVALERMSTMADGIAVARPGDLPFAAIQEHFDEVVTVSEESMSRALVLLLERAKMVVEPSGAAAVAAVLDEPGRFETPDRGGAVRRQRRPAAAGQPDPARPRGQRPLPELPLRDPRPSGRAGPPARRARRVGRQRARGGPRAHLDGAAHRRGGGGPPARDARCRARRGGAGAAARPRLPRHRVARAAQPA